MCRNGMRYFTVTFTELEAAAILRHEMPPLTQFGTSFDVDVQGAQTVESRKAQEKWRDEVEIFVMKFALPNRRVSALRWSKQIAREILYRNIREECPF